MWFDANAALASLEGPFSKSDATAKVGQPIINEQKIEASRRPMSAPSLSPRLAARVNHLPDVPPQCAVCGMSDWTVAVTLADGRKLHVICGGKVD
jgi:hypothetical protein